MSEGLTTRRAAGIVGCHPSAIIRMVRRGLLPHERRDDLFRSIVINLTPEELIEHVRKNATELPRLAARLNGGGEKTRPSVKRPAMADSGPSPDAPAPVLVDLARFAVLGADKRTILLEMSSYGEAQLRLLLTIGRESQR